MYNLQRTFMDLYFSTLFQIKIPRILFDIDKKIYYSKTQISVM